MNPFAALGLPVSPDLTDDDVRSAWRRIAAATHPDRADGGDQDRYTAASAAYARLRTRSGRGEARADLAADARSRAPVLSRPTQPAHGQPAHGQPDHASAAATQRVSLAVRVRRGRPALLAVRLAVAAAVSVVAFAVTGAQPAAFGLATGALTWFLLTVRHDLAPPR